MEETFGRWLASKRQALGYTQARLAELVDVGQTAVSHWERDEWRPTFANVSRLGRALGVDPGEIAMRLVAAVAGDAA
ncbi:MAG TPA: helix-turn-helix transcriptional regulator [Acidimicrobiales bacterium]|jgi:transcriptional regulator with XRE-family HTH domain